MATDHTLCAWFGGCNRVAVIELTNHGPDGPWEPFCLDHAYPATISFAKGGPINVRAIHP
jgi:hypothetical protein